MSCHYLCSYHPSLIWREYRLLPSMNHPPAWPVLGLLLLLGLVQHQLLNPLLLQDLLLLYLRQAPHPALHKMSLFLLLQLSLVGFTVKCLVVSHYNLIILFAEAGASKGMYVLSFVKFLMEWLYIMYVHALTLYVPLPFWEYNFLRGSFTNLYQIWHNYRSESKR